MVVVALLFRPRITLVEELGGSVRILADDILVMAPGDDHKARFMHAYNLTHAFFNALGALLAPSKSAVFSTSPY